jgi:hypothetical protein
MDQSILNSVFQKYVATGIDNSYVATGVNDVIMSIATILL